MTFPSILLGLVIALLFGAMYHVLRDGSGWRLLLYLGVSILGFAAGQLIGMWRGWNLFMLGSLNLGMGIVGCVLFLVAGEWLSRTDVKKESSA